MLQQGKITCRTQRNRLLCQAQQFNPCLQRKDHFSVERTGRSRKNCYGFSFFPNDLFDNFLQFNFWTNWSLQGNTACSRQFWWKRLRTNCTTQCQHKDVSKDFGTRNYRSPSTKPPEMENYPGMANPDWSSAQGKTVTRCIIWRLLGKGLQQLEVSKGRGFPRTQHTLQEGPWRGHPNPPNYYLGSFLMCWYPATPDQGWMHRPARQQMNCWSSSAIWEQIGGKPKLKAGNWMIWPQCWTQNGILALEHFAQVFFMCLHTASNMTGGHTARANEFSQNPYWKTFKRFKMDILHVALMCSVPNFTGDRGA